MYPPPPSFVGYPHKLGRFVALLLVLVFCFALAGCGDNDKPNDKPVEAPPIELSTFKETINDLEWTVSYDSRTREVVEISAYTRERDNTTRFASDLTYIKCDKCTYYVGTPIGDGWFSIVVTIESRTVDNMAQGAIEYVLRLFPDAEADENGAVVWVYRIFRYEEKFRFSVPT